MNKKVITNKNIEDIKKGIEKIKQSRPLQELRILIPKKEVKQLERDLESLGWYIH